MADADVSRVVALVAYSGASGAELLGALAAFHAAGMEAELVGADAVVHTREGARLVPHRLGWGVLERAALVVVPSGDVARASGDAALVRSLRARRGQHVMASGAGLRLAWAAGLLEGRRVAHLPGDETYPGTEPTPSRMVADGRVLTCFGGDSLVDLALHHVAREKGDGEAAGAAGRLGREHRPFVLGASQP